MINISHTLLVFFFLLGANTTFAQIIAGFETEYLLAFQKAKVKTCGNNYEQYTYTYTANSVTEVHEELDCEGLTTKKTYFFNDKKQITHIYKYKKTNNKLGNSPVYDALTYQRPQNLDSLGRIKTLNDLAEYKGIYNLVYNNKNQLIQAKSAELVSNYKKNKTKMTSVVIDYEYNAKHLLIKETHTYFYRNAYNKKKKKQDLLTFLPQYTYYP